MIRTISAFLQAAFLLCSVSSGAQKFLILQKFISSFIYCLCLWWCTARFNGISVLSSQSFIVSTLTFLSLLSQFILPLLLCSATVSVLLVLLECWLYNLYLLSVDVHCSSWAPGPRQEDPSPQMFIPFCTLSHLCWHSLAATLKPGASYWTLPKLKDNSFIYNINTHNLSIGLGQ